MGENGAGKTALLEAIHLLARGRSFRTPHAKQLICHDQSELLVRGEVASGAMRHSLARSKSSTGANEARIDSHPVNRQSRYAELLPLQTLLPGVADLVLDGPAIRREFIDWGLFHVEPNYLVSAQRFRKALTQRAVWLKTIRQVTSRDPCVDARSVWCRDQHLEAAFCRCVKYPATTNAWSNATFQDLRYHGSGFSEEEVLEQLAGLSGTNIRNNHVGPTGRMLMCR